MASKSTIIEALKKEIEALGTAPVAEKTGTIVEIADGIARMNGLTDCLTAEMLEFPGGTMGSCSTSKSSPSAPCCSASTRTSRQGTR